MGIAEKIGRRLNSTKATGGGNYINAGEGILVLTALKAGGKPEYYNGDTAVGEFKVVANTPYTGLKNEKGELKQAGNQVGSDVATIHQLEDNPDVAWPNLLNMLRGIFGPDMEPAGIAKSAAEYKTAAKLAEWSDEAEFGRLFEYLTGKDQPAKGTLVAYSTYERQAKGSGRSLTLIKWSHIANQTDEQIAARRAQLEAGQMVTL